MLTSAIIIILSTIAIWWCSEQLSHGTDAIGRAYDISPGVRGATLDAVASSFPEFCTVVFALIAGHFDAGVGAIAGSALFNILVIPALASLVVGGLDVRSQVVKRDGLLYVGVVVGFITVFYFGEPGEQGPAYRVMPAWSGMAAMILYSAYVVYLVLERRAGPAEQGEGAAPGEEAAGEGEQSDEAEHEISVGRAVFNVLLGMTGVGFACHFLVEHGLHLITELGFSAAVAGVTILAAATSLPDTLLSVFAAKRGDADGAIANAFASNTFDILVCLGLPILISGGLEMNWDEGWSILVCLFLSTVAAVWLMITEWKITAGESILKLALYVLFCVAIFMGWL